MDQDYQSGLLVNSLHSLRIADMLTESSNSSFKYFDSNTDAKVKYFPTFEKIGNQLASFYKTISELKLDLQELIIYKAYLAFCSGSLSSLENKMILINNFNIDKYFYFIDGETNQRLTTLKHSNFGRLQIIQFKLAQVLQKFMHLRRNENDSSQALLQSIQFIQRTNLELQNGLRNDLEQIKNNNINEYNYLKQYLNLYIQ